MNKRGDKRERVGEQDRGSAANLFISPLMHNNAQCQGQEITGCLRGILAELAAKCDLCATASALWLCLSLSLADIELPDTSRLSELQLGKDFRSCRPLKLICASTPEIVADIFTQSVEHKSHLPIAIQSVWFYFSRFGFGIIFGYAIESVASEI